MFVGVLSYGKNHVCQVQIQMARAAEYLLVSLRKKVIGGIVAAQLNWEGHALKAHFHLVYVLVPAQLVGPSHLFGGVGSS